MSGDAVVWVSLIMLLGMIPVVTWVGTRIGEWAARRYLRKHQ